MPDTSTANNLAFITGEITPHFRPCPGNDMHNFYMMDIAVKRLSGNIDYIPVTISRTQTPIMKNHTKQDIRISGRFMSYNYHDPEGSHLSLSLYAESYALLKKAEKNENIIFLDGYLSRTPLFRITPLGCKITELTIAINYPRSESDYIPCICWNKNAVSASLLPCGTHIQVLGRIQSREYLKKLNESIVCTKTAYEVSIWKIIYADTSSTHSQITLS